jgi:hypothetical protein
MIVQSDPVLPVGNKVWPNFKSDCLKIEQNLVHSQRALRSLFCLSGRGQIVACTYPGEAYPMNLFIFGKMICTVFGYYPVLRVPKQGLTSFNCYINLWHPNNKNKFFLMVFFARCCFLMSCK